VTKVTDFVKLWEIVSRGRLRLNGVENGPEDVGTMAFEGAQGWKSHLGEGTWQRTDSHADETKSVKRRKGGELECLVECE